jgi:hypothetical protein
MTKTQAVNEPQEMLRGLMHIISNPHWLEALTDKVPALKKAKENGDVVCIATDPQDNLTLQGWIIASGGQVCYRFEDDRPATEDLSFWKFAADNYIWVTPSMELRKKLAIAILQKEEPLGGAAMKLPSSNITPEDFILRVTGIDPSQPAPPPQAKQENLSLF